MTTIYTRSPYKIAATGTAGQQAQVKLYIYNSPSSVPTTPTRILSKPIPSALLTTVYFNISPYIQEYIDHIIFTESTTAGTILDTEYALCKVELIVNEVLISTKTYKALNGYGYNSDGWNFSNTIATPLMSEGEYLVSETTAGSLYFDTTDDGNDYEVEYRNITTNALINDFVINGGINKIPYVDPLAFAQGGNKITINEVGQSVMFEAVFKTNCNGKYTPVNIDFVNRFGVWQRLTMFGAKRESISTDGTDYKFMNRDADFNPNVATEKTLNINGNRSLKLNTGLVDEFYKDVILQLSLSEVIMIDDVPYKLTTKMSDLPNHTNVKQINYSLEFKEANKLINTGI